MSKYKDEALKSIRKSLEISNRKRWKTLTEKEKEQVVEAYYQIRDRDYKNIHLLLRGHAEEKRQFAFLVLGIGMGVFANPISSILVKYFPAESVWDDLLTLLFFGLVFVLIVIQFMRMSSESLGEEGVLEKLLEIGKQNTS